MKLSKNFKAFDDTTKDQLKYQVSQSILIKAYETCAAEKNPLIYKARQPHGQTIKQLEAFAGSIWGNCLFPMGDCLMRVVR